MMICTLFISEISACFAFIDKFMSILLKCSFLQINFSKTLK